MYPRSIVVLLFALGLQTSCYGGSVKSNSLKLSGLRRSHETAQCGTASYRETRYGIECASYVDHGFGTLMYFRGEIIGEAHVESCEMDHIARFITIQSFRCHHHVEVCLASGNCGAHDIMLDGMCPVPEGVLMTLRGSYQCINDWCVVERDDSGTLDHDVFGS